MTAIHPASGAGGYDVVFSVTGGPLIAAMTVNNTDPGGIGYDDLRYVAPTASATFRNPTVGGWTNPAVYTVNALPVLGSTFTASIVTTGKAGSYLAGYAGSLTLSTGWGNLLVDSADPGGELLGLPWGIGDPTVINLPVPGDLVFCGFACSTQAARFGGGIDLTNAQDLILGR